MRTFFKCVDVCVGLLVTASTVIADMPGQSPRHNYPKLTVKVVDSQGKPVEGVVVHLFLSQFPLCACNTVSGCHIEGFPAATDAKGKAVFERLGSGNT